MSSQLRDFIKANRTDFNKEEPSAKLWEKIEAELNGEAKPVKKLIWSSWMSLAAMILVVLSVAITIGIKSQFGANELADKRNSFKDQQMHFASLIEEKKDSLEVFSSMNPELYKQFVVDLQQLDRDYLQLQEQLKTSPNQQVVVRAMIKNLEIRASMLSQQLQVFNHVREVKQEKIL